MKDYLEAGEFTTTHGVVGELRLYPWSDDPAFLQGFRTLYLDDAGRKKLQVLSIRPHKNICIVKLDGIDSIEAARPYIGKLAYIARRDAKLPPGRFFVQDLIDAHVLDADTGEDYGSIRAVTRPGRHDVYEVHTPADETVLFPAVEPFLVSTDIEAGKVMVRPIPGMFHD